MYQRLIFVLILLVMHLSVIQVNAQDHINVPSPVSPSVPQIPALPPSERVFSMDVDFDGQPEILLAYQDQLSLVDSNFQVRWTVKGKGTAHLVTAGTLTPSTLHPSFQAFSQKAHYLVVAWGMGRGFLQAPLVIGLIDPKTGQMLEILNQPGERTQAVHLQVVDLNGDQENDLAFAYFQDKYFVKTQHWIANQTPLANWFLHTPVRMATTFLYADLGDSVISELIGRVYGEEKGEFGDLELRAKGRTKQIPLEKGLKQLYFGPVADFEPGQNQNLKETKHLLMSDGWVANYGKKAKATLKKITFENHRLQVEALGESVGEYTFFDFLPVSAQDGKTYLFLQGSHFLSLVLPKATGDWTFHRLSPLTPTLNIAVFRKANDFYLLFPDPNATVIKQLEMPK
jgi:hypothetical protein